MKELYLQIIAIHTDVIRLARGAALLFGIIFVLALFLLAAGYHHS